MRRIFFLIYLVISGVVFSRPNNGKIFYVVESLDQSLLSHDEIGLLDSCLNEYHEQDEEAIRLDALMTFVRGCSQMDYKFSYSQFVIKKGESFYYSGNKNQVDRNKIGSIVADAYLSLGAAMQRTGEIIKSLENVEKALFIAESIDAKKQIIDAYAQLGVIYIRLENDEDALFYFELGLKAVETYDIHEKEVLILNNIAVVESKKGNHETALFSLKRVLEISKKNNNDYGQGIALNNIGGVYANMDSNAIAMVHFNKALIIFKSLESDRWLSLTYREMAEVNQNIGELEKGLSFAEQGLVHAKNCNEVIPLMEASFMLNQIHKELGNFEKSLLYYEQFIELKDSLTNQNVNFLNKQTEQYYDYKEEKIINEKDSEKRIKIAESEKKIQRIISLSIGVILVVVITFFIFIFRRLNTITVQKAIIETQNNERELLLKEIHHRVKNNFQIVSSVLRLQAADEENEYIDKAFDDAINRIHSMAIVHEMIYQQEDFNSVDLENYFSQIMRSINVYSIGKPIHFEINSSLEVLDVETLIPLGIAVNELMTFSIKQGFTKEVTDPKIKIDIIKSSNGFRLVYCDNTANNKHLKTDRRFGLELIYTVVEQINGVVKTIEDSQWNTHLELIVDSQKNN